MPETRAPLDTLWRRHAGELRLYAMSRGAAESEADDVVAEAFLRLATRPAPTEARAWLFAVVRNLLVDRHRARAREVLVPEVRDATDVAGGALNRDLDRVRDRYTRCVRTLVDALPAGSRSALLAVDADGASHSAAAVAAGLSVPGMKSRVQRARRQVLATLESCCTLVRDVRGTVVALRPVDAVTGCSCTC